MHINLDNSYFRLVCATINRAENRHFYGIYNIENNLYLVDDLNQSVKHLELQENITNSFFYLPVATCLYYKV